MATAYKVKYIFESLVGKWRDTKAKASTYEVSVDHDSKVTIRTTRHNGTVVVSRGLVREDYNSGHIVWGKPPGRRYWLSELGSRSLKWEHQHLAAFVWHRVGEESQPPEMVKKIRKLAPPPLIRSDERGRSQKAGKVILVSAEEVEKRKLKLAPPPPEMVKKIRKLAQPPLIRSDVGETEELRMTAHRGKRGLRKRRRSRERLGCKRGRSQNAGQENDRGASDCARSQGKRGRCDEKASKTAHQVQGLQNAGRCPKEASPSAAAEEVKKAEAGMPQRSPRMTCKKAASLSAAAEVSQNAGLPRRSAESAHLSLEARIQVLFSDL